MGNTRWKNFVYEITKHNSHQIQNKWQITQKTTTFSSLISHLPTSACTPIMLAMISLAYGLMSVGFRVVSQSNRPRYIDGSTVPTNGSLFCSRYTSRIRLSRVFKALVAVAIGNMRDGKPWRVKSSDRWGNTTLAVYWQLLNVVSNLCSHACKTSPWHGITKISWNNIGIDHKHMHILWNVKRWIMSSTIL